MSNAEFLLAVNIGVSCLLGSAFLAIAIFDKTRVSGRWLASAYLCGVVYFAVEFAIPLVDGGIPLVTIGYAAFLAGLALFAVGLSRFYGYQLSLGQLALVFAACIAVKLGSDVLPRGSFVRLMLYQAPYAVMQGIGAWIVLSSRRGRLDDLLAGLLTLSALHFLAKPFIAVAAGGVGATPAAYSQTLYAQISQSSGAILSVAVALLLLVILVTELVGRITIASQTDTLSGLFNRRGFEVRSAPILEESLRTGMPVSLVLCDLDRFKSVNDSYGHSAGDRLIAAFARSLRGAVDERHLVGRIGGEEFAILAASANQGSARLLAETIRIAFARAGLPGMPATERFTASFGVAELLEGETMDDLFRRADRALYTAKKDGRDCVRTADALTPFAPARRKSG
jgi:diguanylate cyclase (GGDEF)-like protein